VFGRGWLARNARMEAIGVRMCLEAQNADVRGGLQREATGAQVKANRSAKGAAASGTAGGGAAAGAGASDAATWDWTVWLTIGLSVAAAVALTLLLVWLWRKHGERAKAYAAAIVGTLETDLGSVLAKVKAAA
jgi:hypothetical protein